MRIGMVSFINTAPLCEVWRESVHEPAWRVIEAPPRALCQLLAAGDLDLGLVSSQEYAVRPEGYAILADLSLSASGPVGSVFLLSQRPVSELAGETVLLSPQSQTSNSLAAVVCEELLGVRPRFVLPGPGPEPPAAGRVAIGDQALQLAATGAWPHQLDLAEVWRRHTGLPFVFALWVVRRQVWQDRPGEVLAVHRQLGRCAAEGRARLAEIGRKVAPRIPMTPEACQRYLAGIEYDLGPAKIRALERYFAILIGRGEASPRALPLQLIGGQLPVPERAPALPCGLCP
ncbi:MAG: menaquinone biosynthesis protein [Thermodesulfobacteriota bacterium]